MSRNCPTTNQAKANNGKPPGLSSFSIGVDLVETERLRAASLTETTQVLHVGMTLLEMDNEFNSDEEWTDITYAPVDLIASDEDRDLPSLQAVDKSDSDSTGYATDDDYSSLHLDDTQECSPVGPRDQVSPIRELGDAVARKVVHLLEALQPYPGDPIEMGPRDGKRFFRYQISDDEIVIYDIWRCTFDIVLKTEAERPNFYAGLWYARISTARYSYTLTEHEMARFEASTAPANAWEWNAVDVLETARCYPGDTGNSRPLRCIQTR